jgi:hypothetical protein
MRKITNIAHCSRSYQYNFSASNYTFESFAMVSPKERADYNIKRRFIDLIQAPDTPADTPPPPSSRYMYLITKPLRCYESSTR